MAKRLFLLLIISLFQIIITPGFLMADNFLAKSPGDTAVLTVIPEPEPEPEPVITYTRPTYTASAPVYVAPAKASYTVSYYVGSVSEYNNIALNLRYDGLYKFRKMIYGHNSTNLLKNLSNRYVGEIIAITDGGVTRDYVVTGVRKYRKTGYTELDGDPTLMSLIATSALGNDIAILTCAGELYGGDASHRLVVFANAI